MTISAPQIKPHSNTTPLVCCVLVNWNGYDDTIKCLNSLKLQDYTNFYTMVVDNASTDDSVERIKEAHPNVELIQAGSNLGFSAGCNVGIRKALAVEADFVWLLNNDTVAPPNTLTRLVAVAAACPDAGITGTVLRYLHDPEIIQAWGGGNVVRWLGYVTHYIRPTSFGPNSYLTFASVLIRKQVFLDVGLMDEKYFMYFDDSDFCFRSRKAGWQLAIAADTAVLHKEGGSTRGKKKSALMERIVTASGLRFLQLHAQVPVVAMMLFLLSKFAKRLLGGDFSGLRAVGLGISDWWHDRFTAFHGGA